MTYFPVCVVDPKFENVHLLLSFFHAQFFETLSTCKLFLRIDVCGSWPVLRGIRWKLSLASHHSFPLVIELSFEKRQASLGGFFCGSDGKECLLCRRPRFSSWVGKNPWRRSWQSTPVFLPGESHGQRSLAGYSPWGCMELDTTEWLPPHTGLSYTLFLSSVDSFLVTVKYFFEN